MQSGWWLDLQVVWLVGLLEGTMVSGEWVNLLTFWWVG